MARTVLLDLQEGQVVWFHSQLRYIDSAYVRVLEVDNLTATLGNGFVANRYTGVCKSKDHDSPPGYVYETEEDWEAERALYRTWHLLRKEIIAMNELPEGLSRRQLLTIRRILHIGE